MVAIIGYSGNTRKAINYNENKVEKGKAIFIQAVNFWHDLEELDTRKKLERFTDRNALRTKCTVNTLHITLEFSPEDRLSSEKMAAITKSYMQKIGFGHQPWLTYRHFDAYKPHVHIVTTSIQSDSTPIENSFFFEKHSEPARKSIETEFGLIRERRRNDLEIAERIDKPAEKLLYGKSEMNTSIGRIVHQVLKKYNTTSLDELNAILGLYNVKVNNGAENSRLRKFGGLQYHALDADRKIIGMPIKASLLYGSPTLKVLEVKFRMNALSRENARQRVTTWLNWALHTQPKDRDGFLAALKKENIHPVLPGGSLSRSQEVFYVDHKGLAVFGDRELGEKYNYKSLQARYPPTQDLSPSQKLTLEEKQSLGISFRI